MQVTDIITPLIAAIWGGPFFGDLYFTINRSKFLYGDFLNQVKLFPAIQPASWPWPITTVPCGGARTCKCPENLLPIRLTFNDSNTFSVYAQSVSCSILQAVLVQYACWCRTCNVDHLKALRLCVEAATAFPALWFVRRRSSPS